MSTDLTDRTNLTGLDLTAAVPAPERARALRDLCGGPVYLPGDAEYDAARAAWNAAVDQRPAAVAVPTDAAQVAEIVRAAAAVGLRVAPQGTGHNAGPLGALDDVVLLRTSAMRRVWIDPVAPRARVEAGALWLDVVDAAAHYGLAALHGSAPDVGVVGYSLGGGMGWLARAHGLAAHHLISADLVLADGSTVHVDATHEPELFWALRGGGGNVGVVVTLEFDLFRIRDAYAGMLVWDLSRAAEVLERWVDWTADAPDAVTTSLRLLQLPPLPELPPALRGRQIVVIDGAVVGADDATSAAMIAGLRDLAPEIDTFARVPAASLVRLHMDPEGPTPSVSSSAVLRDLPAAGQRALLAAAGPGSGSGLFMVELRQLGGALARPAAGGGALDRLDGAFVLFAGTVAMTPEISAAGQREAHELVAGLAPWLNGRQYLNFAETPVDAASGFAPEAFARLTRARAAADPTTLLRPNHAV
ncbi:FAD-binding oxidoreductase [Pengzhenrongella sicca]|uniref:FAD-dependent oxidoreductase n=1 Tax=Pengzhenrongella sicca TaxID=2819238 RepID=A0A8A4ZIU6_9MICO|nr:FAD-dependent oxidoreductase [Pengzhenrongella sicca]QTE30426.1 FAD-dependent oxidoreductase [Pengzhenrongella sicca]